MISYLILAFLFFSLNSCEVYKDTMAYEYLKNFNNRTNKSIESVNGKIIYIENLLEINERRIEQLRQDIIKLEEKNEEI
jgi:hypothetical protein